MADLRNVVVVIGAAGGIGRVLSAELSNGRHVVAVDVDPAVTDMTGEHITGVHADAADEAALRAAFETASAIGPIDAMVHAALVQSRRPLADLEPADLRRVLDVGAASAASALQLLHAHGSRPASGVLIGSVHGSHAAPRMAAYAMAKSAMRALARAAAIEWGAEGLRCNIVEPGYIAVPGHVSPAHDEESMARLPLAYPSARLGTPEDVTALTVFLLSQRAGFINGAIIPIDGGMSAVMAENLL